MNFPTLHTILVRLGPVTPEFTLVTIKTFCGDTTKIGISRKYLRMSLTYLDLLYRIGKRIGGDDYLDIRLAVSHGTLLWQPVKFGRCSQTSPGTTFIFFASALDNGLANCKSALKGLNGNDTATSYTNLTNFRQ